MVAPIINPEVARDAIISMLNRWLAGDVNEVMVLEWADLHVNLPNTRYLDQEPEGSAAREVMLLLSCLDMHMVIADDIPSYIAFLNTPAGEFAQGWARFCLDLESIDMTRRRQRLKDHPLYQIALGGVGDTHGTGS